MASIKFLQNKLFNFIVKFSVSLAFVVWLVLKIDWREVSTYALKVSPVYIVLYVVVLLIGMLISSYKWKILSEFKGFDFPFERYFQLYLTGTFLNNFFPSFIGGDTYRAYQIGKQDSRYVPATASVVMDRVTGLLGAMVLSVIFAGLNWRMVLQYHVLLVIVAFVIAASVGFLCLGFVAKLSFWRNITKFLPKKVLEVAKDFADFKGGVLKKTLLVSIVYGLIGLALVNYVLFSAMGIHIGILNYLTVIFLISIVSSIPVSINNIGIKEWAYVTFFGFFGVAASAVITVALLSRILQMVVSFSALPYYLKNHQKK